MDGWVGWGCFILKKFDGFRNFFDGMGFNFVCDSIYFCYCYF